MSFSRRDFVKTSVLGAVAAGVGTRAQAEDAKANSAAQDRDVKDREGQSHDKESGSRKRPIIITPQMAWAGLDELCLWEDWNSLEAMMAAYTAMVRARMKRASHARTSISTQVAPHAAPACG